MAAVALGILAVRNALQSSAAKHKDQQPPATPPQQPATDAAKPQDSGMVIQRNGPVDNGMAVRSPFNSDPGIALHSRTNGHS